jgi:hypothetical protein
MSRHAGTNAASSETTVTSVATVASMTGSRTACSGGVGQNDGHCRESQADRDLHRACRTTIRVHDLRQLVLESHWRDVAGMRYAESSAPVAQLDRASASGAEGHRFESCRARHFFECRVTNG